MSDKFDEFDIEYNKLNKAQREAVDTIDGPVMVVAGPGSGKTQILSLRVSNILRKTDVPPHGILCLTFTEAGAINMLHRLKTMIGIEAYKVNIFTFHAFGTNIISRYPEYFFNHANLSPADELVQREIMTKILESLDHNNPFASFHNNEGYVFLKDILSRISQIKKAGINPKEFDNIILHNNKIIKQMKEFIGDIFVDRLSVKIFPKIEKLINDWETIDISKFPSDYFSPISIPIITSLKKALDEAKISGKTISISEWKKKYTSGKNENISLKSSESQEKLECLSLVYKKYKDELFERGYFDYDDMILEVIDAIKKNENLKAELQEQFLYIMVDEFQDTNDAQIRLIRLLIDNSVNENKPNIMVVGDDDQAIYRFQGADVSNIMNFHANYSEIKKPIVMTENYRSGQNILDLARSIIITGENRLEGIVEGINKELISSGKDNSEYKGDIKKLKFKTKEHQYHNIALRIKNLIEKGHNPKDIAVISRKHKELENLVPYMHHFNLPIVYEKQQNVLATPHIHQLIEMCRFLELAEKETPSSGDSLMPEILSYPFWGISPKTIWEISLEARSKRDDTTPDVPWLSIMLSHGDKKIKDIGEFFVSLIARSRYEPVEYILESLIGAHVPLSPDNENEEIIEKIVDSGKFISPYKDYYFSKNKIENNKPEYLRFLSGLKFFINALRNHKGQSLLKVSDLVSFVDIHESSDILLNDTSPFTGAENAIKLMSAHKSKGLEFETVYLLSCQNDNWSKGGMRNKIRLPENLPIEPEGDNGDDDLRLFYVALTRAKKNLYLSTYSYSNEGSEAVEVKYLNNELVKEDKETYDEDIDTSTILETTTPNYTDKVYIESEKAYLSPLVENYKLSVSHFNNYLNLVYGEGPKTFFEQNLVRFPQPMSISNIFGNSIHKSLEICILKFKESGVLPSKDDVINIFKSDLSRKRISEIDKDKYLKRGIEALGIFYEQKIKDFKITDQSEVDFRNEGVILDKAEITGKIDLLRTINEKEVDVFDFKTGDYISEVNKTEKDKLKEWSYKNQIIFYKLLIENSKNYKKYTMKNGIFLFVEPEIKENNSIIHEVQIDFTEEDVSRTEKLIEIIFYKIKNLDFPNVDKYPKTLKGIVEFEEDLLLKKI